MSFEKLEDQDGRDARQKAAALANRTFMTPFDI